MHLRLKVLASVYACDPQRGSEHQVGWTWVCEMSRYHEVWAFTAQENRESIEIYLHDNPLPNVHWVFYRLPQWLVFWRRGQRGERLHYNLWQWGIYGVAKKLHARVGFDIVHHLTYAQFWSGSHLARLPINFVWGPVGGGESTPSSFAGTYTLFGRWYEMLRDVGRFVGRLRPIVRASARNAKAAFGTTPETAAEIERLGAKHVQVMSNIALSEQDYALLSQLPTKEQHAGLRVMSVGRLLHWKGFHLGLRAFARVAREYSNAEYVIIGEGPDLRMLEALARELGISHQVKFWGAVPRSTVLRAFSEADVLLHPSLHESGGMVILEAQAAGCPVICLDVGGPKVLVDGKFSFKVQPDTPQGAIDAMAVVLGQLAANPAIAHSKGVLARQWVYEHYCWATRGEWAAGFYEAALVQDHVDKPTISWTHSEQ